MQKSSQRTNQPIDQPRARFMQTCTVDETEQKEKHTQNTKYITKVILKHVAGMNAELSFGTANKGETS